MKPTLFKPLITLSLLCLAISVLMAEVPNTMSYQAIIRDAKEELVSEETVKMRISILQGTISGDAVYVETHTTKTNTNGLIAIEIGGGEAVSGNIAVIDWSSGPYFIKTETDITGGENYGLVNTSQLLSVPYALHAKTADRVLAGTEMSAIPVLTNEEIGSLTPGRGQMVLNITDDMLMVYSGSKWMPSSGGCWPQPNRANAGKNQTFEDGKTTHTYLAANKPDYGCTGKWSIVSGENGVFEDDTSSETKFSGSLCTNYTLKWTIESPCSSSSSNVNIYFTHTPTKANAGPNQTYTDGTTRVTLTANTPEEGTGKWSIVSGDGGSFEDDTDPKTKFIGKLGQIYTLEWTISTECSSSSSTVQINLFNDAISGNKLTDIDGNTYNTVWIGGKLWMQENLKATKYNDGTDIPYITDDNQWSNLSTPAYCYYNNDDVSNKNTYGALYNWYTVNTGKLCPEGWHVPTDAEWTELENYLADNGYNYDESIGGGRDKIAKAMASDNGWHSSANTGSVGNTDYPEYRNKSDFGALPGGYRDDDGTFGYIGYFGYWWSSTEYLTNYAYYRNLSYDSAYLTRYSNYKQNGFSVRCVRDK